MEIKGINIAAAYLKNSIQIGGEDKAKDNEVNLKDGLSNEELLSIDADQDGFITSDEFKSAMQEKSTENEDEIINLWNNYLKEYENLLESQNKTVTETFSENGKLINYTVSKTNISKTVETVKEMGDENTKQTLVRFGSSTTANTKAEKLVNDKIGDIEVLIDEKSGRVRSIQSTEPKVDISGISYLYSVMETTRFDQITINGITYKEDNLSINGDVVTVKNEEGDIIAQITIGKDRHITNIILSNKDNNIEIKLDKTGIPQEIQQKSFTTKIEDLNNIIQEKQTQHEAELKSMYEKLANATTDEERNNIANKIAEKQKQFNNETEKLNEEIHNLNFQNIINSVPNAYKEGKTDDLVKTLQTQHETELKSLNEQLSEASTEEERNNINNKIAEKQKQFNEETNQLNEKIHNYGFKSLIESIPEAYKEGKIDDLITNIQIQQETELKSLSEQLENATTEEERNNINNKITEKQKQFYEESAKLNDEIHNYSFQSLIKSIPDAYKDGKIDDLVNGLNSLHETELKLLNAQLEKATTDEERNIINNKIAEKQKQFNEETEKFNEEIHNYSFQSLLKSVPEAYKEGKTDDLIKSLQSQHETELKSLNELFEKAITDEERNIINNKIATKQKQFNDEIDKVNEELHNLSFQDLIKSIPDVYKEGKIDDLIKNIQTQQETELKSLNELLEKATTDEERNIINNKIVEKQKQFNDEIDKVNDEIHKLSFQDLIKSVPEAYKEGKTDDLVKNLQEQQKAELQKLYEQLVKATSDEERKIINNKITTKQKQFNDEIDQLNNEIYKLSISSNDDNDSSGVSFFA